ncbi:hypothetical protein [Kibdelosporangium phytohabitans]|uniref:Uncharacterized protein n=1 Tax=Kibdelosporangium phytohabitans TaxID=860235 RepID=A0A0N7F2T8_9PSEU|nr:hypothetical protein [Kibdelosporangium phytohabitans]ALG06751.1 hypothetical protein AOZ06_07255 [Kibdelosporangium phytohabitans]MBE1467981.1 hypothetical protein [Kibdelosporangium phytohabitans]
MEVRPAAFRLVVVVLLGILVSLTLWSTAPGLFGLAEDGHGVAKVTATVKKGAGCSGAASGEIVTFFHDGEEHQATLDACGHRAGESVDVGMPAELKADMTVQAGQAATGESDARRPVAFVLFLLACFAGGGFAYLYGKLS